MERFISEKIGTEYKEWGNGDTVFISSPTGSGKTTFVLKDLLPYLAAQRKKLLYLVNRTILKQQLEKEIEELEPSELRSAIQVELYQKVESQICNLRLQEYLPAYFKGYETAIRDILPKEQQEEYLIGSSNIHKKDYFADGYNIINLYKDFHCVVCDEAHYFFMDSNYNTNTILSYNFVKDFFGDKIRIYMSATIDQIKERIEKDNEEKMFLKSYWFGIYSNRLIGKEVVKNRMHAYRGKKTSYSYSAERNYNYLDIGIIKKRDEIAKLVTAEKDKWLIFVDSKEFGKSLRRDILNEISDNKELIKKDYVSFITADYEMDTEAAEEVVSIVTANKQSAKVLIATSVLDNGINIKDIELRNIIIIADTEVEFLQMLGRKRKDDRRIKLYIYKLPREHFVRRRQNNIRRRKCAEKNYNVISKYVKKHLEKGEDIYQINETENDLIKSQHKLLLQEMMNDKVKVEDIKAFFLAFEGILYLNKLSYLNVEHLNQFYKELLQEYDKYGENAFLIKQLKWLNKTDSEINEIILEEEQNQFEKSLETIKRELEKIVGITYSKSEAVEIEKRLNKDLKILVNSLDKDNPEYKTYSNLLSKNDRVISGKFMKYLRKNFGFPYCIEAQNETWTVKNVED